MRSLLYAKVTGLGLLSLAKIIVAFPGGAGSCDAGTAALLQPDALDDIIKIHGNLMQVGTGPLTDYGLTMELDGIALDPYGTFDFTYGEEHQLTLTASTADQEFTGFLVRLGSTDRTRTLDSLLPIPDENDADGNPLVQAADSTCRNVHQVGGVTQVNNLPKGQVNMTLFMETASTALELDVTVVIKTNQIENISQWYYNRYTLNAIDPPGTPTMAPVPMSSLDSEKPTSSPVDSEANVPQPAESSSEDSSSDSGAPSVGSKGFFIAFMAIVLAVTLSLSS